MSMNNSFLSGWRWTLCDTREKVEIKPAILAKEVSEGEGGGSMKQEGVGGWVGVTRDKWFQFAHSPSRLMTTHVSVAGGGVACTKLVKDHRRPMKCF